MLLLIIAIGVTAGTASKATDKPGLYVVYIGLFIAAIFLAARGTYFCTMKTSHVEGPV
jgi:hypothetical protein